MWEDLIIKSKNAGLDVIDTYIFWNIHEPTQGNVSLLDLFSYFFFCIFETSIGDFFNALAFFWFGISFSIISRDDMI